MISLFHSFVDPISILCVELCPVRVQDSLVPPSRVVWLEISKSIEYKHIKTKVDFCFFVFVSRIKSNSSFLERKQMGSIPFS